MSKAATPKAFPDPGSYRVGICVTLQCATRGAAIRYSLNRASPASGAEYDAHRLIPLAAVDLGDRGIPTEYTVTAGAFKEGMDPSDATTFTYLINRSDRSWYTETPISPGAWMIADYEGDKMFVLAGGKRALLIDTGFGSGDLRAHVDRLTGGLPLDVVITHGHADHVAQIGQFQRDCRIFMHGAERSLAEKSVAEYRLDVDLYRVGDIRDGYVFDLGGRSVQAYELTGHTAGGIVLLDRDSGLLFTGDALGSNRPTVPDSMFMQLPESRPVHEFLPALKAFRKRVRGTFREMYTGHNDIALFGETYMDNLQRAAQYLVDRGPEVLAPSPRPPGVWQTVVGDRLSDPNWVAINVNMTGKSTT